MGKYALRRLGVMLPLLFAVSIVVFALTRFIPGDIVDEMYAEYDAQPQVIEEMRRYLGLDRAIHVQYFDWITHLLRGDLGHSLSSGRSITKELIVRFPATAELTIAASLISLCIAIPLGVLAGRKRNSSADNVGTVFALIGLAIPNFFLGTVLILIFALYVDWFPSAGHTRLMENPFQHLRHLVLPAITLGTGMAAVVMRLTRSSMLEVISQDYIRTARAKGLSEKLVVLRHALRNALIPIVTIVGIQAGNLLGGAIVVERIFSWPGLGGYLLVAIEQRDYPVIQAIVLMLTVLFVLVNLVVDLLYAVLDPRIRYG